jgi:rSAM/selenodomain-associated transferase 2
LRLSVIVPTRRCTTDVARRIWHVARRLPTAEIVVVEPDSGFVAPEAEGVRSAPVLPDDTLTISATRGRGTQCNAGARVASGDILLFLHDDTWLPERASQAIEQAFRDPSIRLACFRLAFDHPHWLLRLYASFSAFDSLLTSFGDQGLVVRRSLFEQLGGFPDWPLFEDVELLRNARRQTQVVKLRARVTTSAVRFLEGGIIRQQLLNAELIVRYLLGATPESLRRRYERRHAPPY